MPDTTNASRAEWFTQSRFGMFIHWGTYALAARHEWLKKKEMVSEEKYQKYFDYFDPDLYDPKDWARQAREAGMKYVVITTKHHEGFCLWDSAHTDYKAPNTPYAKDLLTPFVEAFRAEGLRVGFYYSLIDWHHPHFPIDRIHPRKPTDESARDPKAYEKLNEGKDVSIYAQYMRDQVKELLTNFGPIDLMWFDFSYGDDWEVDLKEWVGPGPGKWAKQWESEKLLALVRESQPQCMVNNRLGMGKESEFQGDFTTPEQYQPEDPITDKQGNPVPWEACQTFSGSWGYYRDESSWKPVDMLLWMLIDGVSKGGNLLLNVGPTGRGEFDERAQDRLQGIGRWMRLHSRAIYGCTAAPKEFLPPPDCRYTYHPETHRLYLHLFQWPFKHVHLKGIQDRLDYAQLLNDASEILFERKDDCVTLRLPIPGPTVTVPVIELFLKKQGAA